MKKTFYCITSDLPGVWKNRNLILLKQACKERGIGFKVIRVPSEGYTFDDVPEIAGSGGIYRLNTQAFCEQFEYMLHRKNPQLSTLTHPRATPPPVMPVRWRELIDDQAAGLPVIPTIYCPKPDVTDETLEKIESVLGGFPIVVKAAGGSHGTGIMLVDSARSLKTLLPHVIGPERSINYVFKKYIKKARHYRLVVLDDDCVSVIEYLPQPGDIRTNAVKIPKVVPAVVSAEWRSIAVEALRQKGVRFGGLDFLVDEKGLPYIAEVNTPCNFSRNQDLTGDDIAGALVDALARG